MKQFNYALVIALTVGATACSSFKKPVTQTAQTGDNVQTENKNQEAYSRASSLTAGWPSSSMTAANEMISKHGEPQETTSDSLIWRNVAPFKKVIVHKSVYSHRFPLLHQNSLEHIVDYRAPLSKVDDVWRYNGSIVLDRTKGEMSAFGENESMNVLSLNLADEVMTGKISADSARVIYGKETMNFLNGKKTAYTQVLNFGSQFDTADQGETITTKIRWIGDPANQKKAPAQNINTRQAQEEKK